MKLLNTVLAALVLTAALPAPPASATPPPPPRERTDCAARVYIVDDLVCATQDLMRLDGLAGDRWMMLLPNLRPEWPSLVEKQTDWYWRRGMCFKASDQRRCLDAAYNDRLEVLAALNERPAAGTGEATECEGPPWGKQPMFLNRRGQGGALVVSNADGVIMAVATPPNPHGWTPGVTIASESATAIELKPSGDGPSIICRRS